MNRNYLHPFVLIAGFLYAPLHGQQGESLLSGKTWAISPQADVPATGEQISTPGFTMGKLVSENFYWRGTTSLDFRALSQLKQVKLKVTSQSSDENGEKVITASVTNPADSQTVAFAIRPMLIKASTGDQILPVHVSDGLFFLPSGESHQVTFRFDPALAGSEEPKVEFLSYNNSFHDLPPFVDESGDLARDKDVTASSSDILLNGPDAAVDGNPGTRWQSEKTDPQWIMIDLEKSEAIGRVKLVWEMAYAISYSIQVSEDSATWTDIYTTTSGKDGTEDLTGLKGQGRYIRLTGTLRVNPKFGYSLFAFEVYGP